MSDLRAYILCRFAHESRIYTSWMADTSVECVVVDEFLPDWKLPNDAGIVVTHMHYRWEEIHALRRIYEQGRVPVLILSDGILEYRNTWGNPSLADGAIFQPLVGHKLACIGRGQARIVESWGNVGRAEVVGLPRLDSLIEQETPPIQTTGPFRLLIATANTPSFNAEQRKAVVESLGAIKQRIDANPAVNRRPVEVMWRLTDGLEKAIGLPNKNTGAAGDSGSPVTLTEAIDQVDAVITTPSTMFLESVLKRRPTALLDFHNTPHYVPAAWMINAPKHLNWILKELADPPAPKMLFQESVLHDHLECRTPSRPRMLQLFEEMLAAGRTARAEKTSIRLPHRMISDPVHGFHRVESRFDTKQLYPDNHDFCNTEVTRLRAELVHARKRLESLPVELVEKNKFIGELIEYRDDINAKNASLRSRIMRLRKILGIKRKQSPDGKISNLEQ